MDCYEDSPPVIPLAWAGAKESYNRLLWARTGQIGDRVDYDELSAPRFSIAWVTLLRIGPASSPSVGSGIGYLVSLFVLIDWLTSRPMEAIGVAKPSGVSSDVK